MPTEHVSGLSPSALAELYSAIGRRLAAAVAGGQVDAMGAVTEIALVAVPGVEAASITHGKPDGKLRTVGATSFIAGEADKLQYRLGEGPCVAAAEYDTVVRIGDMATEERWPQFCRQALEKYGVSSMLSYRLFLEDEHYYAAALNLYSFKTDAFDDAAQTVGLLLATHGALAVQAARAEERAKHLAVALESNREIGVAMGIIMATSGLTRTTAFDVLRIASQHMNRKLAELATEVIATGVLPIPPEPAPRLHSVNAEASQDT